MFIGGATRGHIVNTAWCKGVTPEQPPSSEPSAFKNSESLNGGYRIS